MKTTVNLSDELVRQARELVETGLRAVLKQRTAAPTFVLPDASVDGDGVQPEFRDAGWARVRDEIYGV